MQSAYCDNGWRRGVSRGRPPAPERSESTVDASSIITRSVEVTPDACPPLLWRLYGSHPRHSKSVRDWIAQAVGCGECPVATGTAALAVSELFANSLMHGPRGGRILVGHRLWSGGIRIVVCDGSGSATPRLRDPDQDEEGGRGLHVVGALSAQWGSLRARGAQVVWCDLGEALPGRYSNEWAWLASLLARLGPLSIGCLTADCGACRPLPRRLGLTALPSRDVLGEATYQEEIMAITGKSSDLDLSDTQGPLRSQLAAGLRSSARHIPLSALLLTGREAHYVQDALDRGWLSGIGDYVSRFECALAAITGRAHVIAVANGTMAIELALRALGVGPGTEVIVPAFTFAAPMLSVLAVGAEPVVADIDPVTWTIDVDDAARCATPATAAIIAVDVLGHPCDYLGLERIGVPIIQDCAQAHGARYRGSPVGSQGLLSVFSFHANKAITTGEGGSIGTNDSALAEQLRLLANHGMSQALPYVHAVVGRNFRMTNLAAAVGLAQVEAWDELIAARGVVADLYRCGLAGVGTGEPGTAAWATRSTWLHTITVQHRQGVLAAVRAAGVDARAVWPPLHCQPVLAGTAHAAEEHPVAERVSEAAMWLPTSAAMSETTVGRVVSTVRKAVDASAHSTSRPCATSPVVE